MQSTFVSEVKSLTAMGRVIAWGFGGCSVAPFLFALLVLRCTEQATAASSDPFHSQNAFPQESQQGGPHGIGVQPRGVQVGSGAGSGDLFGSGSFSQSSAPPVSAGPLAGGSVPPVGAGMSLPVRTPLPVTGAAHVLHGAAGGLASAANPAQNNLGDEYFSTFSSGASAAFTPQPAAPSSRKGESLPSRAAVAARLPLSVQGNEGVTNDAPVTETRIPVGFRSSANGVYMVPRFPWAVKSIGEPSEEMIRRCAVRISASKMTNGFSETLKSGTVQIYGNAQQQLLRVVSTSSPRYTSKVTAPYVLLQRIGGARVRYEVKVGVPQGCVLVLGHPNTKGLVRREGPYIVDAKVQLTPDVLASHMPSVAPVPSDVLTFAAKLPRNSNFRPVGHCAFVAHFTAPPEHLRLAASYTAVQVTVQSPTGSEVLGMKIPLMCLPQSHQRTAMWATPVGTGTAVIVAFSPPPAPERSWHPIPLTVDEAAFNSSSPRAT